MRRIEVIEFACGIPHLPWTKIKTVTQRWPKGGVRENASFVIPTMR